MSCCEAALDAIRGCWSPQPSRARFPVDSIGVFWPDSACARSVQSSLKSPPFAQTFVLACRPSCSRLPSTLLTVPGYEMRRGRPRAGQHRCHCISAATLRARRDSRIASRVRRARRWSRRSAAFRPAATSAARRPGEPGWWDDMVGPGKPLDTDRFRVLGIDFLGGRSSLDRARCAATDFPSVSAYDQARVPGRGHGSPRHREAARLHRRLVRRHGDAGARRTRIPHDSRMQSSSAPRIARIRCRPRGAACSALSCATPSTHGEGEQRPRAGASAGHGDVSIGARIRGALSGRGRARGRAIRFPGRGVPALARRSLCGALLARSIRLSVRIDRPASHRAGAHRRADDGGRASRKTSSCRSPTCARCATGWPAPASSIEINSLYGHDAS